MKLATLCYLKKDGKTLMLHRIKKENDYHKDKWNGLGGKFLHGETPEECAFREIKEESGLEAEELTLKGIITFPIFDGIDDWYVYVFTCNKFSGNLIDSDEGKLEWIEDESLFDLPLWEGDKIFLNWLIEDRFFSAKFVYEDKQLISHSVCFY
ncbi:MAG: 8-oxo-dGTP diphosphatase [Candidatus Cloacimonetes bacterium]|nr:8-oxo-dGTP diphosphatase [Candidatus Cloacimonadota bacterium]